MTADPFTILRVADMLQLQVSVINLERDGSRLVRKDRQAPAVLVFTLPPQHVGEQTLLPEEDGPFPATVPAASAGESRVALMLPEGTDGIDLTSQALLAWELLEDTVVPVDGRPDDGEVSVFGGLPRTAVEFPARLLLGQDSGNSGWVFLRDPPADGQDGRTPVWRAELRSQADSGGLLKAFATFADLAAFPQRLRSSLSDRNLDELVMLTSAAELIGPGGVPVAGFERTPLHARHFVLTPLGASVSMAGTFAPTPVTSLIGYQHLATLGRDQRVQTVERGYLSSGHEAVRISSAERKFKDQGGGTSVAYLELVRRITVIQPAVTYGQDSGYPHDAREMPFRTLRITDVTTPPLADDEAHGPGGPGAADSFITWVRAAGAPGPYRFTMDAVDSEGRHTSFTMPLMFVTQTALAQGPDAVAAAYNAPTRDLRQQVALQGQTVALAGLPDGVPPGTTSLPVEALTFRMAPATGHPLGALPALAGAAAHIPAVEQFTGSSSARQAVLDTAYLDQGFGAGPSAAFLSLADPLNVSLDAEKAGGIARPAATLQTLTAKAGLLPPAFAGPAAPVGADQLRQIFGDTKLLGSIDLFSLLDVVPADAVAELEHLREEDIADRLALKATGLLPVPLLRARELIDGRELRYLWKPALKKGKTPLNPGLGTPDGFVSVVLADDAALALEATTRATPDAAAQSTVHGVLTGFRLEFTGIVGVDIGRIEFLARAGRCPDLNASGVKVDFGGALEFVNQLKDLLPAEAFGKGVSVDVTPRGIDAGYTVAVPSAQIGIFGLSNLSLSARLMIPFGETDLVTFRFSVAERFHPFNLSAGVFGGGGFFSLTVSPGGIQLIEGALEFGGNTSLDLGVASGGVHLMGGIYFAYSEQAVQLTGYLRCGGYLSVLDLVTVSVEFYLKLTYAKTEEPETHRKVASVYGEGSVTVGVKVAFFSKSVSLSLQRRFGGSPADPVFTDCMKPKDWDTYCLAFVP